MKILYIQPYCPTALLVGGELRNRRFTDFLSKRAELDIFILMQVGKETDWEYLKTRFRRYYFAEKINGLNSLEQLQYLLPWQLAQFYSREAQRQLNQLLEEEQYDFIFANKLYPVPYLLRIAKKWHRKVIVDFDDILSDLHRSSAKDWIKAMKVGIFIKINEEMALKSFKKVFVCAEEALAKIPKGLREKAGVAPNVFTVQRSDLLPAPVDKKKFLFVGSLDYEPNVEGLQWFLETVWPNVCREHPGIKLTIVGKTPQPEQVRLRFSGYEGVAVHCNVPGMKEYYRDSFVSIVPLLNGSGTRLKILESSAYGRPVITTLKGMEGLAFKDKKDIFLFKDAATFGEAYRALLRDDVYSEICRSAFATVETKYSPAAFERAMDQYWRLFTDENIKTDCCKAEVS